MSKSEALKEADEALTLASIIDELTSPQMRVAELIGHYPAVVKALVRLRASHLGHVTATAEIIEKALRLHELTSLDHERLLSGTQDMWKSEVPLTDSHKFRKALMDLVRAIRKVKQ